MSSIHDMRSGLMMNGDIDDDDDGRGGSDN